MTFNLKPFLRQKNNTVNDWCFEYVPYGAVRKSLVKRRLKNVYPDLKVLDVRVIKSIKRILVVVKGNVPPPWAP